MEEPRESFNGTSQSRCSDVEVVVRVCSRGIGVGSPIVFREVLGCLERTEDQNKIFCLPLDIHFRGGIVRSPVLMSVEESAYV